MKKKYGNNTLSDTSFQHILSHRLKFMWVALWVSFFYLVGFIFKVLKTREFQKNSVSRSVIECVNDAFGNNDPFTYLPTQLP